MVMRKLGEIIFAFVMFGLSEEAYRIFKIKNFLLMIALLLFIITPEALAQPAQRPSFIQNALSARCIDVAGAPGRNNGATLILWDCETSGLGGGAQTDQIWVLDMIPNNRFFIRNTLSGRCIDVPGAPGGGRGTQLILWDCETSGFGGGAQTDQIWVLDMVPNTNHFFIRNALSGLCIDVPGAPGVDNGKQLILWDCETSGFAGGASTDQIWLLVPR